MSSMSSNERTYKAFYDQIQDRYSAAIEGVEARVVLRRLGTPSSPTNRPPS